MDINKKQRTRQPGIAIGNRGLSITDSDETNLWTVPTDRRLELVVLAVTTRHQARSSVGAPPNARHHDQ